MQRFSTGMLLFALFLTACGTASDVGLQQVTPLPESQAINVTPIPVSDPVVDTEVDDSTFVDPLANESNSANAGIFPTAVFETAGLEPGVARAQALEQDMAYTPDLENPMTFDNFPVSLQFNEFYDGYNIRTGLILSDKLQNLDGQEVVMEGYVAPPLAPRLDFFVLTRIQLAYCPFCSRDADWPDDIVLVYLPELQTISSEFPVRITGTLHVGSNVDAETGMVSLVRIYADEIETLN